MILKHARIKGFRAAFVVEAEFGSGVSYIIGRNGTGKTTFVRLLVAALTADTRHLLHNPFDLIELTFVKDSEIDRVLTYRRDETTITPERGRGFNVTLTGVTDQPLTTDSSVLERVRRLGDQNEGSALDHYPWFSLTTQPASRRPTGSARQQFSDTSKLINEGIAIRRILANDVQIRWLPIERTLRSDDPEEQRQGAGASTPINRKVTEVQNQLVRYFAELDKKKAAQLELFRNNSLLALFDIEVSEGGKAIARTRVDAIETEIKELIPELHLDPSLEEKFYTNSKHLVDWLRTRKGRPIEVLRQSLARLEQVLSYWRETQKTLAEIFAKRDAFIAAIENAFSMSDLSEVQRAAFSKKPELHSNNELDFKRPGITGDSVIRLLDLSSGEKQFLIMLSEALLEREAETILIIDEPELSLHINWQSRLVHDLRLLNPNVQLILATHSPDVVSTTDHALLRMEDIVSV